MRLFEFCGRPMAVKPPNRVCREHNISKQTYYRSKKKYRDMKLTDIRRLMELEKENAELKKMLAESMLENRVLA